MAAPWVVTCSCGWTSEFSRRWAARRARAKLHPRLRDEGTGHTVTIEEPPAGNRRINRPVGQSEEVTAGGCPMTRKLILALVVLAVVVAPVPALAGGHRHDGP
jgi:hypothetical protein